MASFGQRLRRERERRGLARSEVAEATSIYIHDLAALEFEDFSLLHGDDVVVERFVRTYAEFLDLEVDALVEDYRRSRPERVSPPAEEPRAAAPQPETVIEEAPEDTLGEVDELRPSIDEPAPPPEPASSEPVPRRSIPVPRIALAAGALAVIAIVVAWSLAGGEPDPGPAASGPAPLEARSEVNPTPDAIVDATAIDDVGLATPTETAQPPTVPVDATLRVTEHGVGTGVADRRLVGESDRFAAGTRVWFWTRVVGGAPGASVDHVWMYEGREADRIVLDVGSANWRTHSAKRVYEIGRWAVEARDPAGAVLARGEFDCVAK